MELVFVHGWGSAPFVWEEMRQEFAAHPCHFLNMGFVGAQDLRVPAGKFIGISHSLGGLWLLKHYPERLAGFVAIGSFNCFYKHIPAQILAKMQRNIAKDMTAQLKEFWVHAGLDQPQGFKNLNAGRLVEGLGWLAQWHANIPGDIPLKILASRDDQIVPEKMSQDIWGDYPIDWIEKGGHMLPLTQSAWCSQNIKEYLDEQFKI